MTTAEQPSALQEARAFQDSLFLPQQQAALLALLVRKNRPIFFKVGRLLASSSDNHFVLLNAPNLPAGLEAYKNKINPRFVSVRNLNFGTGHDVLDHLQAGSRLSFVYKCSQASGVPESLQKDYISCYQKVCADAVTNPAPLNLPRGRNLGNPRVRSTGRVFLLDFFSILCIFAG
jgi:hypothetical protein